MYSICLKFNKIITNQKRLICSLNYNLPTNLNNQMICRKILLNKTIGRKMHSFFATNIFKNRIFNSLKTISNLIFILKTKGLTFVLNFRPIYVYSNRRNAKS